MYSLHLSICGDEFSAREIVARLVEEIGGHSVDAGPLTIARYEEPAGMLLVQLAYVQGLGSRIGFSLVNQIADGARPQILST